MPVSNIFSILIPFVWFGLVAAISFIEAPLKFTAPGVTLPVALSIGKKVFNALNKVEWACLAALILCLLLIKVPLTWQYILTAVLCIVLLLQTFVFLPAMNRRAALIIGGKTSLPSSSLHYYYVGGELLKMICLAAYGWIQLAHGI